MAKITQIFLALLILPSFSCFVSHGLRIIKDEVVNSNPQSAGKEEKWFHFAFPPIPAADGFKWPSSKPWPHWEYVQPPRPAGGYKWPPKDLPHWQFVSPPAPAEGYKWPPNKDWPHWQFVYPPVPAGGYKWPPQDLPHWHFVYPPPTQGSDTPADSGAAAPPPVA